MAEVDRKISRLARRQHGVVATRDFVALGASRQAIRRRVEAERLHPVHRGVYAVGQPPATPRSRWMAAVLALGPQALLSHRAAASLWGLRGIGTGAIDVMVPGVARVSRRGIRVHLTSRLDPDDRAVRDRIPVSSIPRTLLDLAEAVPLTQLRRAYEEAARLTLLDVSATQRLLDRSNGRRGLGALRTLLGYDPAPAAQTASELERLFLDLVRGAGLPTPAVNVLVAGFVVDVLWPAARLVVELDGYAYHRGRDAFERDRARIVKLTLAGYEVLPLTHRQVTEEPAWVVGAIRALLPTAPASNL